MMNCDNANSPTRERNAREKLVQYSNIKPDEDFDGYKK
jgi:hypothetical protein